MSVTVGSEKKKQSPLLCFIMTKYGTAGKLAELYGKKNIKYTAQGSSFLQHVSQLIA